MALQEFDPVPEKLIMPVEGGLAGVLCDESLLIGLGDMNLVRSNALTNPDRFFSELSEGA